MSTNWACASQKRRAIVSPSVDAQNRQLIDTLESQLTKTAETLTRAQIVASVARMSNVLGGATRARLNIYAPTKAVQRSFSSVHVSHTNRPLANPADSQSQPDSGTLRPACDSTPVSAWAPTKSSARLALAGWGK